jgi:hypothetical protein
VYLRLPFAWRFFGKQFLVIGKKLPKTEAEFAKE